VRARTAAELPAEPPAPAPGAGARPLERIALRAGLARLPERLREVVWLRYYEDLDEAQTADALGIPRGTVKSRLHDAIRALKREWEEDA
jgi:RNA polymerase sigma-70 factor (ECF subfamily)